jgi:glutathione S-transferase
MKLFHSPASPFVRKVMVIAHETGQTLELLACKVTPVRAIPSAKSRPC